MREPDFYQGSYSITADVSNPTDPQNVLHELAESMPLLSEPGTTVDTIRIDKEDGNEYEVFIRVTKETAGDDE